MEKENQINQDQFFDLITGEDLSWQSLIYDLVKTEQLDPWDIDLGVLAKRYIEIIHQLEEADFFISSKVLLACSLLLRLKSEILITSYIKSLDDALYGKKEDPHTYELERITIDEDELPILVPKTPLARHRKVTLQELMEALNKAITTENRRIKKEIRGRQAKKDILTILPKGPSIPLKVRIKKISNILKNHMEAGNDHLKFSELASSREQKLASFVPVLHLATNGDVHLRQQKHFDEIHMAFEIHKDETAELESELGLAEKETNEVPPSGTL